MLLWWKHTLTWNTVSLHLFHPYLWRFVWYLRASYSFLVLTKTFLLFDIRFNSRYSIPKGFHSFENGFCAYCYWYIDNTGDVRQWRCQLHENITKERFYGRADRSNWQRLLKFWPTIKTNTNSLLWLIALGYGRVLYFIWKTDDVYWSISISELLKSWKRLYFAWMFSDFNHARTFSHENIYKHNKILKKHLNFSLLLWKIY